MVAPRAKSPRNNRSPGNIQSEHPGGAQRKANTHYVEEDKQPTRKDLSRKK